MAPICSNCRRLPAPDKSRRCETLPQPVATFGADALAKKARRSICEAARLDIRERLPGRCPGIAYCAIQVPDGLTDNGTPHRESANHLPRSHHCHTAPFLAMFARGGPDFRLAGAHQAIYPNAPPKWRRPLFTTNPIFAAGPILATGPIFATGNFTRGQAEARTAVLNLIRLQSGGLSCQNALTGDSSATDRLERQHDPT